MNYNFFIPVEMCRFSISAKFNSPFKLFIYLKGSCDGKRRLIREDLIGIGQALNCDAKTVKNNLKKLLAANWIGYNKTSGYYFIRSFEKIRKIQGFKSRTGAEFKKEDLNNFKAFLAGSFIGYLVNQQRRKKWVIEREKRRSYHMTHQFSSYFPVSNIALSKILNVSISTAYQLKKSAHDAGFIQVKKNFRPTLISSSEKLQFQRGFPEIAHKVKRHKNYLILQETDTVTPFIHFKRRKKIETYIRGS